MRRDAERLLDEYLAASARAGDRRDFERLARRWERRLLAHAYRLTGDAEAAREAAQDGWADIARGIAGLDDAALFPAWAYRIVTRRCADAIRRAKRRRRTEAAFAAEPAPDAAGPEAIEACADGAPLRKAIASLPSGQRAALALFHLEQMSVAEVAAALAVPAGTVKTCLMHARAKLRSALEGGKSDD